LEVFDDSYFFQGNKDTVPQIDFIPANRVVCTMTGIVVIVVQVIAPHKREPEDVILGIVTLEVLVPKRVQTTIHRIDHIE